MNDDEIVSAFRNFLTWGEPPRVPGVFVMDPRRCVPPAWYAYALGLTQWCPPKGEM